MVLTRKMEKMEKDKKGRAPKNRSKKTLGPSTESKKVEPSSCRAPILNPETTPATVQESKKKKLATCRTSSIKPTPADLPQLGSNPVKSSEMLDSTVKGSLDLAEVVDCFKTPPAKRVISTRTISNAELKVIGEHMRNLSPFPWKAAPRKRRVQGVITQNDAWENVAKSALQDSRVSGLFNYEHRERSKLIRRIKSIFLERIIPTYDRLRMSFQGRTGNSSHIDGEFLATVDPLVDDYRNTMIESGSKRASECYEKQQQLNLVDALVLQPNDKNKRRSKSE